MATTIIPKHVQYQSVFGVYYEYIATENDLTTSGVLEQSELPGPKCRSRNNSEEFQASRLKDGRVRLLANADAVLSRDKAFKKFIGSILSDCRLSLVAEEVAK